MAKTEWNEWLEVQKAMGCPGCKYADEAAIGKKPCCTFAFKLDIGDNNQCLTRQGKKGGETMKEKPTNNLTTAMKALNLMEDRIEKIKDSVSETLQLIAKGEFNYIDFRALRETYEVFLDLDFHFGIAKASITSMWQSNQKGETKGEKK